jgi:hypothetical protein
MADRAAERAEAAESLSRQLQQQLHLQQQTQQRLSEKATGANEQLKHLRSDGDTRVIAEREVRGLVAGDTIVPSAGLDSAMEGLGGLNAATTSLIPLSCFCFAG